MRPKKICEYAAPADPRTEKRPACAMVRRSLLRAAVVAACVAPGAADLTITITSPVAGHVYHTGVVFPSAHVVAGPGPLSDAVLAAPGDFELCADGDAGGDAAHAACYGFHAFFDELPGLRLETKALGVGGREFRVWLRRAGDEAALAEARAPYAVGTPPRADTILAMHYGHDAALAVVTGGEVEAVIELERLPGGRRYEDGWSVVERYTGLAGVEAEAARRTYLARVWAEAGRAARLATGRAPDFAFGDAVYNPMIRDLSAQGAAGLRIARDAVDPGATWHEVDHHASHAALALFDAAQQLGVRHPLVVAFDGGGNDGHTLAFAGNATADPPLARLSLRDDALGVDFAEVNFANRYAGVAAALPEVARGQCAPAAARAAGACARCLDDWPAGRMLALAGKMMGYSALGAVRAEWLPELRAYFLGRKHDAAAPRHPHCYTFPLRALTNGARADRAAQRALARTAQRAFEDLVVEMVSGLLARHPGRFDGVALSGGAALNVLANERLAARLDMPVHVPAAPGDCGLPVGSAWLLRPPPLATAGGLQHAGPLPWDSALLGAYAARLNATRVSVEDVADLLAEENVVGVVRGRAEHGPRALGHRSLLAVPARGMKERLNGLKKREWFRPVAPVVAVEAADRIFERRDVRSPYMSFAPALRAAAAERCPAMTHYDRSSRPQTVAAADDAWLHALLLAVAARTRCEALINTSFNARGRPILNTIADALGLLRTDDDLDYVLVDDWLFAKRDDLAAAVVELSGVDAGRGHL